MKAKKSLWNDTFKIDITFPARSYTERSTIELIEFKGSLKGAIRFILREYKGQTYVANFKTSDDVWLKEIGV